MAGLWERWRTYLTNPLGLMALAVNLLPILGVTLWGWSLGALVILYWIENVIVGVVNLARMALTAAKDGAAGLAGFAFMGPFFTFHYGMFCLVHGVFVVGLFGGMDHVLGAFPSDQGPEKFLPEAVFGLGQSQPYFLLAVLAIAAFKLAGFLFIYVARGDFKRTNLAEQMGAPYGRIIFLHLGIFAGAFGLTLAGSPIYGVALLALAKTAFDIWSEAREATKPASASAPPAPPPPG
jgi:hypothetical protein